MSDPNRKKQNMAQRESILKFVLMQNTNDQSESLYNSTKFQQENFPSESEEEFEF